VPEALALPAAFALGERHYRRSEESWANAGRPRADVNVAIDAGQVLRIDVRVEPSACLFVHPGAVNPLDNEPAAINGDGVQLYVSCGSARGGWLLVPDAGSDDVVPQPISEWSGELTLQARWRPTTTGYTIEARVVLPPHGTPLALDVIVNETVPGRARRRGQLVLSGARQEFVYLRGDRHDAGRLLRFNRTDV
jgi:hypothetical protein